MPKPYVYVAGHITIGDRLSNIQNGCLVANALHRLGMIPFVPFPHELFHMLGKHAYNTILRFDMAWIEHSDCLFRIPGESPGADKEVSRARRLEIPVLESQTETRDFLREWRHTHGNVKRTVGFAGGTAS